MVEQKILFCRQASRQYERWLDENGGDPRLVARKKGDAESRTPYRLMPPYHPSIAIARQLQAGGE